MKKLLVFLTLLCIMSAGCNSKELSREEALRLIQPNELYPKVIDYDIYCSDPAYADVGKPLIQFTPKAQNYLLTISLKDKVIDVQKVKLADAVLSEVTGIKTENEGNNAVVEYTTIYKNITPFSALTPINFNLKTTRKAHFSLYDDGWKFDK